MVYQEESTSFELDDLCDYQLIIHDITANPPPPPPADS